MFIQLVTAIMLFLPGVGQPLISKEFDDNTKFKEAQNHLQDAAEHYGALHETTMEVFEESGVNGDNEVRDITDGLNFVLSDLSMELGRLMPSDLYANDSDDGRPRFDDLESIVGMFGAIESHLMDLEAYQQANSLADDHYVSEGLEDMRKDFEAMSEAFVNLTVVAEGISVEAAEAESEDKENDEQDDKKEVTLEVDEDAKVTQVDESVEDEVTKGFSYAKFFIVLIGFSILGAVVYGAMVRKDKTN